MPPQIALVLCVLIILYLLKIDSDRKLIISNALWLPSIWMMVAGSRLISQWLNINTNLEQNVAYVEGNPVDRIYYLIFISSGLFILGRRKIGWGEIFKCNIWIFLFLFYCGISISWSDFPLVSFKRLIKEVGNIVMLLIVLTESNPTVAVKTMIKRCAYVLIPLSILFIKYYPNLGTSYSIWTGAKSFKGVTDGKNMLGNLCLVTGLFFSWELLTLWSNEGALINKYKKKAVIYTLFLLIILWLLVIADSATSLICFLIGASILIGLGFPIIKQNRKYIGILFFLAFLILLFGELMFNVLQVSILSVGRDMTLTGRTELWGTVISMNTNSIIGTGYESFWLGDRIAKLWEIYWWQPNQAHNGYLEIYLNLGYIGLFLFVGVIVKACNNCKKMLVIEFEYGRFLMAFLLVSLLYNITDASFNGLHLIWLIFLLTVIEVPHLSINTNSRK